VPKERPDSLEELLEQWFDTLSKNINTVMPGVVEKKNSDNTVDVRPAIKRKYQDGLELELSLLLNVPVLYPYSSKMSLSWPLEKGDPVVCIFSQRDLENWKEAGGVVSPGTTRHHDISDGFCFPAGAYPGQQNVDDNKLILKYNNAEVTIDQNDQVSINGHLTIDK